MENEGDVENEGRSKRGVVLSIHATGDGMLRLVIDDVVSDSDHWPQVWRSHIFVTRNEYDLQRFLPAELTESELSEIGAVVVARLAAAIDHDA